MLADLDTQPRVVVYGGAGTGKTVLAVDAARRLASAGQRVLFLCFNRLLAAKLASHVSGDRFDGEIVARNVDDHFVKVLEGTEFESEVGEAIDKDKGKAFATTILGLRRSCRQRTTPIASTPWFSTKLRTS